MMVNDHEEEEEEDDTGEMDNVDKKDADIDK